MVQYVCREHPTLKVAIGAKRLQFENGLLTLTEDADVANFDEQLATRPAISALVSKVDKEAALAVAMAHKKEQQRQTRAVKGTVTSESLNQMRPQTAFEAALSETDPETAEQLRAKLEKDQLVGTVAAEPPVEAPVTAAEEAKTVGATLGLKK